MTLQSYWPSLERLLLKPLSTATATFAFEQIPQPTLTVAYASWSCSFLQNLRMKLKTIQPLICSFKPLFLWKIISVILLYDDGTEQCFVLLQVPKCFVPVQIFWASPKIWLHLVPFQKPLCRHKKQFYWMQIFFMTDTKC